MMTEAEALLQIAEAMDRIAGMLGLYGFMFLVFKNMGGQR